jgi:hypothetical protein
VKIPEMRCVFLGRPNASQRDDRLYSNARRRCQTLATCQKTAIKPGRQLILRPDAFVAGGWTEEEQDVLLLSMRLGKVSRPVPKLFDQWRTQAIPLNEEFPVSCTEACSIEASSPHFAAKRGISKDSRHTWTLRTRNPVRRITRYS